MLASVVKWWLGSWCGWDKGSRCGGKEVMVLSWWGIYLIVICVDCFVSCDCYGLDKLVDICMVVC